MKRLFRQLLVVCIILLGFPVLAQSQEQSQFGSIEFNDISRGYYMYIPTTYDESIPIPMVVMLHGRGSDGRSMATSSNMNPVAEENGFIALYPDGVNNEWGYLFGFPFIREGTQQQDTVFLNALIDAIALDYNIDRDRIYAAGLSNGGFMAQRLGCEASDVYAAVASVAATGFGGMEELCDGTRPIPFMLVHGSDDPIVPWDGAAVQTGNGGQFYISAPAPDTFAFWAIHNQCGTDFEQGELEQLGYSPGTVVRILRDQGTCADSSAVLFLAVVGGGHTWPGVRWAISEDIVGRVNMDFNASEALWDFFSNFTLNPDEDDIIP